MIFNCIRLSLFASLLIAIMLSAHAADKTRKIHDFTWLPSNIYEAVCLLGKPVYITNWSLDKDTRFVVFKGPFTYKGSKDISPFVVYSMKSISAGKKSSSYLINSLKELSGKSNPAELVKFDLQQLNNIPGKSSEMKKLLGNWSFSYVKRKRGVTRVVYEKNMCIGEKHVYGVYFDIKDDTIVRAKGIKTKERLNKLRRKIAK